MNFPAALQKLRPLHAHSMPEGNYAGKERTVLWFVKEYGNPPLHTKKEEDVENINCSIALG